MLRVLFLHVLLLLLSTVVSQNERCPDKTTCPTDLSTCCPSRSGSGFNCCPLAHAVCCEGGLYCCPSGTTCNSKNGTCEQEWRSFVAGMKWDERRVQVGNNDGNQVCPDKQHECSSKKTCCRTSSHEFGCCPYEHAVCCPDNEHCCPSGTSCNLEGQTCDSLITPRIQVREFNSTTRVLCPGGKFECADGNTCCQLETGYGCCPLDNAVCCPDKVHCCPNGFTCQDEGCQKPGSDIRSSFPNMH